MISTPRVLALACALSLGAACGPTRPERIERLPTPLTTDQTLLVSASNRWSLDLLRQVAAEQPVPANLFLSPFSAHMALSMAENGAAGDTATAMQSVLRLDGLSRQAKLEATRGLLDTLRDLDPRVRLEVANAMWIQHGLPVEQTFIVRAQKGFDADVDHLDFNSADAGQTISDWVAEATQGKIEGMGDSIDPATVMMLVNAVYFKGSWRTRFDKARTAPSPFFLPDGTQKNVTTMVTDEDAEVYSAFDDELEAVDLPYGGDAFRMTIVMPRDPGATGELARSMDDARWRGLIADLDSAASAAMVVEAGVRLPKLIFSQAYVLNDTLAAMGMGRAFDPARADFSGISTRPLHLGTVRHKTFVAVDEEGTEAAAATSVGMDAAAGPITIDRPFIFAIRERLTGAVLFLGVVVDPSTAS